MSYIFNTLCHLLDADFASNTNSYYIAVSKFTPWTDEANPDAEDGTYVQGDFNLRKELILGKKLQATDAAFLINNNVWTIDTVYAQYDDADPDLDDKNFYVINSNDDVFKCIANNNGGISTQEPVSKTTDIFQLSDGYKWKYIYTLSSANNTKFGTSTYIPVDANSAIKAAAVPGTIDNIVVVNGGSGYGKYATGSILSASANSYTFRISDTNSGVANYYNNMMLYISAGEGDSNTTKIAQSFSNSSGIFIITRDALSLDYSSNYVIYPEIVIEGNGTGAEAICTINTVSQSISSVDIINPGSGYTDARVYANNDLGDAETLRAIISPVKGHGFSAVEELKSERYIIITTMNGNESGAIPTELSFREYLLLKNPTYANGVLYQQNFFNSTISFSINVSSSNTNFIIGETFTGNTSNAVGIVGFGNTTTIVGVLYSGQFVNGETIYTSNSDLVGTISNINNPQINVNSGEILFYDTSSQIERSASSLEDVGFILTNVSGN